MFTGAGCIVPLITFMFTGEGCIVPLVTFMFTGEGCKFPLVTFMFTGAGWPGTGTHYYKGDKGDRGLRVS